MNWSDYEGIWKRQELPVGPEADFVTLTQSFEAKRRKTAALYFARDVFQMGASLMAAIALGFVWWQIGTVGWPIALSVIWALSIAVISLKERLRVHHKRLGPDVPLLVKIDTEIAELSHQRHLLLTTGMRYVVPGIIAIAVAFMALARRPERGRAPSGFLYDLLTTPPTLAWIVILTVAFSLFIWRAWRANHDEVFKQIDPRLAELEKLHREIKEVEQLPSSRPTT